MSDLQIALILIGIVLLLGVVLFNWWQDKRAKQHMQQHFPDQEADPLFGKNDDTARVEPAFESVFSKDIDNKQNTDTSDNTDDAEHVDPSTEAVIDISFITPIDSVQIYAALRNIGTVIQKPIRIFAQTASGLHRARLRSGESYESLQFAILLANRQGPLTDIEWCNFWAYAQKVADTLEGDIEGPEIKDVQLKANALDNKCANLDAQVGLVIQLENETQASEIKTHMLNLGFVDNTKQFVFPSETKAEYFTVLFNGAINVDDNDGISRLDFLIDLPHSKPSDNAFSRMAQTARTLSKSINAKVLSEQGTALPESTDKAIDNQLIQIYQDLDQAGFTAGTDKTIRIFS